jgi:hypothetical protein
MNTYCSAVEKQSASPAKLNAERQISHSHLCAIAVRAVNTPTWIDTCYCAPTICENWPNACCSGRYKPPVRIIRLTEQREITPYKWVHPDEEQ